MEDRYIPFVRIDGRTSLMQRQRAVEALYTDAVTRVMLLSITAGGAGLNLVAANHVLLLEPHFNPASEDQAADRVFRVGQHKPVHIHRLLCTNTIEEHVRQIQVWMRQEE